MQLSERYSLSKQYQYPTPILPWSGSVERPSTQGYLVYLSFDGNIPFRSDRDVLSTLLMPFSCPASFSPSGGVDETSSPVESEVPDENWFAFGPEEIERRKTMPGLKKALSPYTEVVKAITNGLIQITQRLHCHLDPDGPSPAHYSKVNSGCLGKR